jgi:hypothetical protein
MNYFYLKGIDKIGPLSFDELKLVKLNDDALIWYEGLGEWTKLSNLPELKKDILGNEKLAPPPIPVEEVKKVRGLKDLFLLRMIVSISIVLVSILIFYLIFINKLNNSKKELIDKIDLIFQGNNDVCDGVKYELSGTLRKLEEPTVDKNDWSHRFEWSEYERKKNSGVLEEFDLQSGGFTMLVLSKEDKGYVLKRVTSKGLEYKVGQYEFSYGYLVPSYRPSLDKCYSNALEYLTSNNKSGKFVANTFNKIENFPELRSDFYIVDNVTRPTSPNLTTWLEENSGNVYTNQYTIYLKSLYKYYEIIKDSKETIKFLIIYLAIGFLSGIFLMIVFNLIILRKYRQIKP